MNLASFLAARLTANFGRLFLRDLRDFKALSL
jgi:hypothetical protein